LILQLPQARVFHIFSQIPPYREQHHLVVADFVSVCLKFLFHLPCSLEVEPNAEARIVHC
jgi:hypothetical protein